MAPEVLAGPAQLGFRPFNAQRAQQPCTGIAGEVLQFAAWGGTVHVIRQVGDRRPGGKHAKPRIEGGQFAQERLEGRFAQPSLL